MLFDSVQVGAADMEAGVREYAALLGFDGERRGGVHRFGLERGAVEIVAGESGVRSLRFRPEEGSAADWPSQPDAYRGLCVRTDGEASSAALPSSADKPNAIDHVVVQSTDLDSAVALWRDRLGVRLALDREFPQRGLRLVFFRSGGVTLEFSGALGSGATAGNDALWGIAYQVADLAACRARLAAAGVGVSEIRSGQKKGTIVATAKSHTLGVPTLLIQPVSA